ncbi:PaaI family thioesterase [Spectribacter hydrogenoxidans]|uniref:PaaI family thioesterase n=1 Tax=Spectribacter hydrogenoxidans TaxID=3075608 RepID=A0ABU3C114_9GAMM|nr:PaaI family thioesterase [Salinisphaera sp. W335]MDT0635250.1 PaaI family thioesterase [Salinisphaera sp. W335]
MNDTDPRLQQRQRIADGFMRAIPHNTALGMSVVDTGPGTARTRLDYRPEFLGDVAAGLWHTGPAISLADATAGLAVFLGLPEPGSIATLDLRMDYLRPALADQPLFADGVCDHITRRIVFAGVRMHQGNPARPTARCTATFMRTGRASAVAAEAAEE